MKSLIKAVALAVVLTAPVASFAQANQNQPLTRAEVRAQLVQLEKAGYNPARGRDPYYPNDIQAAEARVAAQNGTTQAAANDVGGVATGTSEAGGPAVAPADTKSLYFGH